MVLRIQRWVFSSLCHILTNIASEAFEGTETKSTVYIQGRHITVGPNTGQKQSKIGGNCRI